MKTIIKLSFCALILSSSLVYGNDNEVDAKSEIKAVTVFFDGAQITRKAFVDLKKGDNKITFTGLAEYINPNSIQVKGDKDFTILSVNHKLDYMNKEKLTDEMLSLKNKLEKIRLNIAKQERLGNVYKEEKNLILSNKSIKSKTEGLDVESVMDLSEFYQERLTEIQYKLLEIEKKKIELNKEFQKINKQLQELNYKRNQVNSEIIVRARTNKTQLSGLVVTYNIWGASWYPLYDLRSSDKQTGVDLTYRAKVLQNSGFDWENVKLTLSTGSPGTNATQPTVTPWILNYNQINTYGYNIQQQSQNLNRRNYQKADNIDYLDGDLKSSKYFKQEEQVLEDKKKELDRLARIPRTAINQGMTETEFEIELPYTIPSDNKEYDVEIQQIELPTTFAYYTAPKFDKDAFLLAQITGWHKYNLLPGNANLYYKETYVGSSFINTSSTLDTLEISLGRDKDIVVERKKVDEFNKTTTSGKYKKTTLGLEVTIRNKKSVPINIKLIDQVPISANKEITVTLEETSGAQHNTETGELKWELRLEPGTSISKRFKYQVKYPKEKTIQNL